MSGIHRGNSLHAILFLFAFSLSACGVLPADLDLEEGTETGLWPGGSGGGPSSCPFYPGNKRVLVDASHDGGAWWFPQTWPFDPGLDHQGMRLAERFRECGYEVDELARGTVVTDSILLAYAIVIRAGKFGGYQESELKAYERYLSREATLVLLSEFLREGQIDPVAEMMGLHMGGSLMGQVTDFEPHAITEGVGSIPYITGSGLVEFDESRVTVLGRLQGIPVMGLLHGYRARIFFLGDTNSLETVPQPLVDNLMVWGF